MWMAFDVRLTVHIQSIYQNGERGNTCPAPWSADNYFDVCVCRVSLFDVFRRFSAIITSHVRSYKQKKKGIYIL
jgi:hypothetical protein